MKTSKPRQKAQKKPSSPGLEPTPVDAAITVECTLGGPAVAGLIARLLIDAGAAVTLGDDRIIIPSGPKPINLAGLEVHVVRVVWVKEVRK